MPSHPVGGAARVITSRYEEEAKNGECTLWMDFYRDCLRILVLMKGGVVLWQSFGCWDD